MKTSVAISKGFLADECMLEEVTAVGVKRVLVWQIKQEMSDQ